MSGASFLDSTLVLLGHGSTLDAEAGAPVYQHAAQFRRAADFAAVKEAFWKQQPRVDQVLAEIQTRRAFIIPLFISEGYFADEVIPQSLGFCDQPGLAQSRMLRRGGQEVHYCRPLGTHPGMTALVLERAREVAEQFPFPRPPAPRTTTLFVAGHGTTQNVNSRQAIELQAERVRARGIYGAVHAVFLEEDPRIESCITVATTRHLIVAPYFIGEGPHVREDLPLMLGESRRVLKDRVQAGSAPWRNPTERRGKLIWLAKSVGTHPRITEVIMERVREAVGMTNDERRNPKERLGQEASVRARW